MPDGDFFWNAWRTYNALSNRTVYTARYAFPSCDSTISSTPGPRPFHGFASARFRRTVRCRARCPCRPSPMPESSESHAWPSRPNARLLVGGRNTTHSKIIPVLGYTIKCCCERFDRRRMYRRLRLRVTDSGRDFPRCVRLVQTADWRGTHIASDVWHRRRSLRRLVDTLKTFA